MRQAQILWAAFARASPPSLGRISSYITESQNDLNWKRLTRITESYSWPCTGPSAKAYCPKASGTPSQSTLLVHFKFTGLFFWKAKILSSKGKCLSALCWGLPKIISTEKNNLIEHFIKYSWNDGLVRYQSHHQYCSEFFGRFYNTSGSALSHVSEITELKSMWSKWSFKTFWILDFQWIS